MERARRGDGPAYGELVRRHQRAALRVATVVLGRADGADDVVQEATLRALRGLDRFHAGAPFRPWFLRIVANGARNHRRSSDRHARLVLRASGQAATQDDPEMAAVADADRAAVLRALNRLGADDRLVIALRHFEELTEAEIALVLDCAAGTVKSRLSRAMQRLRRALEEVGTRV